MVEQINSQPRIQGKFATVNDEPLSKHVTGVRLPISLYQWLNDKPNRTDWVRNVIVEAARKEMQNSHSGGK